MEDHYGIPDLRQFISDGRPFYPTLPPPPDLHPPPHPYNMVGDVFRSDSTNNTANTSAGGASSSGAAAGGFSGFEMEAGGGGCGGGVGRWPRQETLTLLEIRSRLDPSFKEANQKGPLWDQVSRIMSEEHGYQRSGKKCREKFENLYKYYKKTKDGKAGRQDGKHYRFFRQLEALYGETNNSASASEPHVVNGNFNYNIVPNNNLPLPKNYNNQESLPRSKISDTSLSLSNFSEYETTSSDDTDQNEDVNENDADKKKKKKRSKRNWKIKIKDFIDGQMRKLMDKQEVWMEKIMTTIEQKEQERISREEEWRKQDVARIEMEHKFWANERAWIEARDSALIDSFHKMSQNQNDENQQKWEMVNNYVLKCNYNKKRNHDQSSICNQGGSTFDEQGTIMRLNDHNGNSSEQGVDDHAIRPNNDQPNSTHHHNNGNAISENCFRYFMGDPYGRILD